MKEEVTRVVEMKSGQSSSVVQRWTNGMDKGMTKDEYSKFIIDVADELISMAKSQANQVNPHENPDVKIEIDRRLHYLTVPGDNLVDVRIGGPLDKSKAKVDPLYGIEGFGMDYNAEGISKKVVGFIHYDIEDIISDIDKTNNLEDVKKQYAKLASRFVKLKQLLEELNNQVKLAPKPSDEPMKESRRRTLRKR